ncbi:hypothetical protein FQN54_009838 [Arachnomyces sp. PD_36]|nr:hypothetical protein FQN54_009838 [Arachnomyces sp. PD_36]
MGLSSLLLLPAGVIAYLIVTTVYNLYFHPLAKIPGPKISAATHLCEFYYDVICGGVYLFKIEEMHRKYGHIVRITPSEVHVSDPRFYDEIHASSLRKRDKDPRYVAKYGLPESIVATVTHEKHRFRRNLLNDFFSKRAVLGLSGLVAERVQKLISRFEEAQNSQTVISLDDAFSALASDVITSYCYGKHWGFLEAENFGNDIRKGIEHLSIVSHYTRFFPWLVKITRLVSPGTMARLIPANEGVFNFQQSILDYSTAIAQQQRSSGLEKQARQGGKEKDNLILRLTDPKLPLEERSGARLQDELFVILGAGTETTARVLTVAAYYLARDPIVLNTLRTELKQVLPTPTSTASWAELEKLPYMNGVVNESLRFAHGVVGRLARVARDESLTYKDHVIPAGTPMSASAYIIHRDPSIFPNPERFDPDRWIKAAERGEKLTQYIVAFSKGSRGCVGINLAYMELFMVISQFARRFDVHLHDTGPEDIRIVEGPALALDAVRSSSYIGAEAERREELDSAPRRRDRIYVNER